MFKGDKVICVENIEKKLPYSFKMGLIFPQVNQVYTIRNYEKVGDYISIRLVEIRNKILVGLPEISFNINYFKPYIE